jgi:thiol:disulfide interchange protein DsbC
MYKHWATALIAGLIALSAGAQDIAAIRKSIQESQPQWPAVDEVSKTPWPGLYEVRINGSQIFYTDESGKFLIEGGNLIDLKQHRNLTEERMSKLLAINFKDLPIKDAIVTVRGNGKRKMAVFADPNCGYCKHFEKDLVQIDNITIYTFLYPILGNDSAEKARVLWCTKDQTKGWQNWMINGQMPTATPCDTGALARNVEFGRKYNVTGTPTLFFADGSRAPGALPRQQVEKLLAAASN